MSCKQSERHPDQVENCARVLTPNPSIEHTLERFIRERDCSSRPNDGRWRRPASRW